MRYQAEDKDLIAEYLSANNEQNYEGTDFDINCKVWSLIRQTFFMDAVRWKREKNAKRRNDVLVNTPTA